MSLQCRFNVVLMSLQCRFNVASLSLQWFFETFFWLGSRWHNLLECLSYGHLSKGFCVLLSQTFLPSVAYYFPHICSFVGVVWFVTLPSVLAHTWLQMSFLFSFRIAATSRLFYDIEVSRDVLNLCVCSSYVRSIATCQKQ